MIRGYVVAAALLALALGACQQSASRPSAETAAPSGTASKPKADEYVSTKVFEARGKELSYKLAERLLRGCAGSMTSDGGMKTCFRERTLAGFDASGLADQHCPVRAEDLDGELGCIVSGSVGYQLAQNIGKDAAAKFDWSDPEGSIDGIVIDFILAELQQCLGGASASSADDCVMKAFIDRLAIPDADVQLCMNLADDFKHGQCLGEAYALKFMAAGIEKI